jgi:hypothetical protein
MQRDFEMRFVEDFARALARIMFFKEMRQYGNAMDELEKLSTTMTGFNLEHIKALGIEGIKNFFNLNDYLNIEKVFYTAKTLKEEAIIYFEQGRIDEGMESIALALGFFELIKEKGAKNIPGFNSELRTIRNLIN